MAKIKVNQSKVTPEIAEKSVKLCPFNAIYYQDGVLGINEACRMCKICVRKGPEGVFSLEEEEAAPAIDKSQWVGIAVFIEHGAEGIHPVSFELIGKARELAEVISHPVYAVLFSDNAGKYTDEILSCLLYTSSVMVLVLVFHIGESQDLDFIILKFPPALIRREPGCENSLIDGNQTRKIDFPLFRRFIHADGNEDVYKRQTWQVLLMLANGLRTWWLLYLIPPSETYGIWQSAHDTPR